MASRLHRQGTPAVLGVRMNPDAPDMNEVVGSHDLLWVVLDSLRHDVAVAEWQAGRTPNLARLLPAGGWEKRHTPGSFTFPAHLAFFAGFLPTPADAAAPKDRLLAARFAGSETTGPRTKVFDTANVIEGLQAEGYYTICVGGVGFFNRQTPLSRVLTAPFDESHWRPETGVTCRESPEHAFGLAAQRLAALPEQAPVLLFVNVAAIHQPNYFYSRESGPDDLGSHAAALRAVDAALPALLAGFARRPWPLFHITCSDHGTAYGEGGFTGHRAATEAIWTVPYAHGFVDKQQAWPRGEGARA